MQRGRVTVAVAVPLAGPRVPGSAGAEVLTRQAALPRLCTAETVRPGWLRPSCLAQVPPAAPSPSDGYPGCMAYTELSTTSGVSLVAISGLGGAIWGRVRGWKPT